MRVVLAALLAIAWVLAFALWCQVLGLDRGQWGASDKPVRQWFQQLMQPDNSSASCCGEADAYWADSFEVEGDHYVAIEQ